MDTGVRTMKRYGTVAAAVIAVGVLLAPLAADPALAADATPDPTATSAVSTDGTPAPTVSPEPTASPEPSATASPTPTPTAIPRPVPKAAQPGASTDAVSPAAASIAVPSASRISLGADPYTASVRASTALFPSGTDTVVLAPAAFQVYASAAASFAASHGAAVLYVSATSIPAVVLAELRRLAPTSIFVAGGTAFVSDAVITAARTVTADVRRFGGVNIYETARQLFAADTAAAGTVYISDAKTMDDITQASVLAASRGSRALLVNGRGTLDAATIASLRAAHTTAIVIVESSAPIPAAYATALTAAGFTVTRMTRTDPYSLSATVSAAGNPARSVSMFVNRGHRIDIGLAGYIAGVTGQPLYYSLQECMSDGIVPLVNAAAKPVFVIGDTAALSAAVASKTKCSTEKTRLVNSLAADIKATLAQWSGSYTVTVRQIGGLGQITQIAGGTRREPASMMKIFAAWAAYTLVARGQASLSTKLPSGVPLSVCIQIMIHVSDNNCHSDIVHWIGIPRINSMIHAAGFTNTTYGNVPRGTSVLYAGNRTTTNDLAYMMERLNNGSVLSKTYADALIYLMRTQIWRSRIASGIPPGVVQASKPGALWVSSGLIQNDTALVNGPASSYILSIMGDGNPPQAALRAISRTVYTHFNGAFGAAAVYPVKQMITKTPSVLRGSAGGAAVGTIPAGVLVEVLDANRVWYEIQYGSRKLWVYFTGLRNR